MTVRQLKTIIADLPDTTLLVVPGNDHDYCSHIWVRKDIAVKSVDGHLNEDWDDPDINPNDPEAPKRIDVLVIS